MDDASAEAPAASAPGATEQFSRPASSTGQSSPEPGAKPRLQINGSSTTSSAAAPDTGASKMPGMRSTSSKFASLRAAFEKDDGTATATSPETLKRRLPSSGERSPAPTIRERNPESEAELSRLKAALAHETELRTAAEENVARLQGEIEVLNGTVASSNLTIAGLNENANGLAVDVRAREEGVQTREDAVQRREDAAQRREDSVQTREDALQSREESTQAREEAAQRSSNAQSQRLQHENNALQEQLAELKRSISSSARSSASRLTDSALETEFGALQHEVQNWVVHHFRRARTGPDATAEALVARLRSIGEVKHLDQLQAVFERFAPSRRLPIFQATVATYLMEVFDERLIFGMPAEHEWRRRVRRAADALAPVLSPAVYGRWRAATYDAVRQAGDVSASVESATAGIAEMACITLRAVAGMDGDGSVGGGGGEDEDVDGAMALAGLRPIVARAVALAHRVRAEPANYDFHLPAPGEVFDGASMEDIDVDGEFEQRTGRRVVCSTFPAVVKIGDELGDNAHLRNIVVQARVLCDDP